MRCVTAILSVAAVVPMAAGLVAQAKPSFAGEWKMVVPGGGQGEPGVDLIITQGATAMTVEYMRGGQLQAPGKLTYTSMGINRDMMTKTAEPPARRAPSYGVRRAFAGSRSKPMSAPTSTAAPTRSSTSL